MHKLKMVMWANTVVQPVWLVLEADVEETVSVRVLLISMYLAHYYINKQLTREGKGDTMKPKPKRFGKGVVDYAFGIL